MKTIKIKIWVFLCLVYALLSLVALISIFPIYHMFNVSFKPRAILYEFTLFPLPPTIENYILLFEGTLMFRWLLNTFAYAGTVALLTIIVDSMTAYCLSKATFPGRDLIFTIILAAMMVPGQVTLIPRFIMFRYMNLINTFWGLLLPGIASPFGVFLLRQYMLALPSDILDSGRIDGCSEWQVFWKIAFPLSRPAIATVAALKFISHWNTFLWPLIVMTTQDNYTVPVGLATLSWWGGSDWGVMMAGSAISVIPTLAIFIIFQKYILAGLTLRRVQLKM